uniref:Nuclear receptor domain-containing protein n=1 Tax=Mesocestoides corti TaxID=53468 RepID=A0A5K3FDV9_MESCO
MCCESYKFRRFGGSCCESCLFKRLNPVAPPPTQGSPFRSMSPAARILNSPLIRTNIYLGLSSHLGLGVITHL